MQDNSVIIIKKRNHETIDINNDYTLADYITDVRKLVRCDTKVLLHNTYSNDTTVTFEGEVIYSILVICEDNTIKNIIYSEDFSLNSNMSENGIYTIHDCKLENSAVRLISPRKINCKSKVIITTKSSIYEDTQPGYTGEGMPEAEYTVEKQTEECECMSISETKVSNQHASRDIEISSDKEEIANIVYCKVETFVNEQKVNEGKLYLRGESKAEILYETVNGYYRKVCDRFPFNDIVDTACESDGYICEVTVNDIRATVRNNSFGEMKIVELDYSYDIRCRAYTKHTVELVSDLYSTEQDTVCSFNTLHPLKLNRVFSSSLSVNEGCDLQEVCDEPVTSVVDCCASVLNCEVSCNNENRRINISGDIKFDIICMGERHNHISVIRSFKLEREYDGVTDDIYNECIAKVFSCIAQVDKGELLLSAELYFCAMVAENIEYSYICGAEFKSCDPVYMSPVIIYYPKTGDTLWEVAKKYKSTCTDIRNVNSMSNDTLEGIKVLLLPKKKQKSIFNRII